MYGYVCDRCGAYLDPGEKCDCVQERKSAEFVKENEKRVERGRVGKKLLCVRIK